MSFNFYFVLVIFLSSLYISLQAEIPPAPQPLIVNRVTDTTVTLSWMTPNENISQYILEYREVGQVSYIREQLTGDTLTYTVNGLSTNTSYEFRVGAVNVVGVGPFTDHVSQTTSYVNVNAQVLSPRSITVTWEFSLTDYVITSYIMSYKALESFADNGTASFVAVVTSLVIDSLEEFVTYTITIQPVSNGVEVRGLSGNTVQVTTWSDVPSGPPLNVTVTGDDDTLLSVMYTRPEIRLHNGDVTGYVIRYTGLVGGGVSQVMMVGNDTFESVISGVVAFTNYSIEVAAVNTIGTGPFSDVVYVLSGQDKPSAPRLLSADTIQFTSVTLSWMSPDTPNGVIIQYEIQYSVNSMISLVNFTGTLMGTIEGLSPGRMYTLQIRAYTRVGAGPFSSEMTLETLQESSVAENEESSDKDNTVLVIVLGVLLVIVVTGFTTLMIIIVILVVQRRNKTRIEIQGEQTMTNGVNSSPSCTTQLTNITEQHRMISDTSYDEVNTDHSTQLQDIQNITVNPAYGGGIRLTLMDNPAYNSTDSLNYEETDQVTYEENDNV